MPDVPQVPQQNQPPTPPPVVPPSTPPTPPPMPPPVPPAPPIPPPQPPRPEVLPPITPPTPPVPPAAKPPTPPAPAAAPEVTPHPPSTAHHKLFGALVVIACLLILIALGFILWPKLHLLQQPTAPTQTVIPIATSTEPEPSGEPTSTVETGTSTTSATTTDAVEPPPADDVSQSKLGDTVALFKNDSAIYLGRKAGEVFEVTAIEFTDSRCPKGVQCIWAGELGVKLRVEDVKKNSQDFYLGMVRAKTVKTMGLTFTLLEIDDGKGGMYAKITVD